MNLRVLGSRAEAEERVRAKQAGTALVIPRGTRAALSDGGNAELVLYTDPVKYLERLNVRLRLLELRDQLAAQQRDAAARRRARPARTQRARRRAACSEALAQARRDADAAYAAGPTHARRRGRAPARSARPEPATDRSADCATPPRRRERERSRRCGAQVDALRAPLRHYLETVQARRAEFERWLGELRRLAGSHAGDIPPPPPFPELPESLTALLDGSARAVSSCRHRRRCGCRCRGSSSICRRFRRRRRSTCPTFTLPALPAVRGGSSIAETNLTGGPLHINTFDQNVPGFSVTFLLLGMLLGVSLGLLDERDWGTLDRLRALPIDAAERAGRQAAGALRGRRRADDRAARRRLARVRRLARPAAVGAAAADGRHRLRRLCVRPRRRRRRAEPRGGVAGRLDRHRHHGGGRRLLVADRSRAALDAHRRAGLSDHVGDGRVQRSDDPPPRRGRPRCGRRR